MNFFTTYWTALLLITLVLVIVDINSSNGEENNADHNYQYVSNAEVKSTGILKRQGYPYDYDGLPYDYYDSHATQPKEHNHGISIIHKILKGFKAFFGGNNRQGLARQDTLLGSAFTSGAWIVPAAVIAVGGLFRDEISDLLTTTTTTTQAPTTSYDPCANKNCGTGFTCNGGICYCGTTSCSSATANVCDAGTCKCGASALCPQTGVMDQQCLSTTGAVPATGDTTATCQCRGSGTSGDSCLVSTGTGSTGYSAMTPYCSTGTSHAGSSNTALGMCGPCQKSNGVAGDGTTQGSCTDSQDRCLSTGDCKCRVCTTTGTPAVTTCAAPTTDVQGTCNTGMLCCMATSVCAASC